MTAPLYNPPQAQTTQKHSTNASQALVWVHLTKALTTCRIPCALSHAVLIHFCVEYANNLSIEAEKSTGGQDILQ